MKKNRPMLAPTGRRRLLGALAAVGSVPVAARAGSIAATQAHPMALMPVAVTTDEVVARERWLLRRDDR